MGPAPVNQCDSADEVRHPPAKGSAAFIPAHPDLPPCAGCGRCCHLVVELRAEDDVPEDLVAVREGLRCMDQHSDGACVALDPETRLCTIYEVRPTVCRLFTRGEALCRQILGRTAPRSF